MPSLIKIFLPRGFYDAGDEALVGHLSKTEAGEFKFAQETSRSAGELAAVSESDFRGIFWHLIEVIDSGEPFIDGACHIEDDVFEGFAFFPFVFHHQFSFLLSSDLGFFGHDSSYFLRAGPFWRCLRLGSFLLMT